MYAVLCWKQNLDLNIPTIFDQDIEILIITLDMVRFDWSDYVIESIVLSAN